MTLDKDTLHWVESGMMCRVSGVTRVSGGKNNRAYCIDSSAGRFFLKQYSAANTQFDNFGQEVAFCRLLSRHSIAATPNILLVDNKGRNALFRHVTGNIVESVTDTSLIQAADFIASINTESVRLDAIPLSKARGSLFSAKCFIDDVQRRFDILVNVEPVSKIDEQMLVFLQQELFRVMQLVIVNCTDTMDLDEAFSKVLSPSDFGFHNAIMAERLIFFDFEYGGWDSAEKLVTDFFAQPRYDVPSTFLEAFIQKAFPFLDSHVLVTHVIKLLPLAHLKWCLIFLNDFNIQESQRRQFSLNGIKDWQQHKAVQLSKSSNRLKKLANEIKKNESSGII